MILNAEQAGIRKKAGVKHFNVMPRDSSEQTDAELGKKISLNGRQAGRGSTSVPL
jgi:hypothetical protein